MINRTGLIAKKVGFTLLELVVAMTLFAIVITLVFNSFSYLLSLKKTADNWRVLQRDTHFAMTKIADYMRSYSVDYEEYQSGGACAGVSLSGADKLCLGGGNIVDLHINAADRQLRFNREPLLSNSLQAAIAIFTVSPIEDPVANLAVKSTQLQPRVSVQLEILSALQPSLRLKVQTTISSRLYDL